MKFNYFWPKIILTVIFTLLVIPNLGARTLWQDEAETALVARQMVKSNQWLPYAYDDQGPISQDWSYQFSVSPFWRWHPWFQFYMTAVSFKIFGISALAARLPFALAGILFFWYWLNFIERYGPKNKLFYWLAVGLVLTSVPLFLHIRQARYYSLALLFTLMAVDGYPWIIKRSDLNVRQGRTLSYSKYILGSILLFHSFLPGALALQISFWIHQLTTAVKFRPAELGPASPCTRRYGASQDKLHDVSFFARLFLITLIFTLPWAIWLKIGGQNLNFNIAIINQNLHWHFIYIHKFIFPFFLLVPFLLPNIRQKFLADDKNVLFSLIILTNLTLYTFNHPYFFRYLVPLIPFFAYIAARIIASLPKKLAVATIFIAFFPSLKLLPDYLFEITHPYTGTNEQLVKILNSKSFSGIKSLAVNYDDFTFRFHTGLIVYGAQELTAVDICPDAIIIFSDWGNEELLSEISERCHLDSYLSEIPYSKLADDPNPVNHRFKTPQDGSMKIFVNTRLL